MRLLKLRDLRVQHLEELRRATGIERRGARRDESETDSRVRHEDMTVDDRISALRAFGFCDGALRILAVLRHRRHHLAQQFVAQSDGVHLDELGKVLTEATLHVGGVLCHLPLEMRDGEHCVDMTVERGVDICREVFLHVVDTVHEVVVGDRAEDVGDDRLSFAEALVGCLERVDKGVADIGDLLRVGTFAAMEEDVGLVLHAEGGEGELRRAVGVLRRGHEFVQVFFEMDAGGKEPEENKQRNHRQPESRAMIAEKVVYPNTERCHDKRFFAAVNGGTQNRSSVKN